MNGLEYARLVGSFNWIEFYNKYGGVIRTFRELSSLLTHPCS